MGGEFHSFGGCDPYQFGPSGPGEVLAIKGLETLNPKPNTGSSLNIFL